MVIKNTCKLVGHLNQNIMSGHKVFKEESGNVSKV